MLHLSELDEQLEKEPNNDPKQANRLTIPGAVTGRFEEKEDIDHYVFTAKKGQRWILEAHTLEHLSPTEVYMVLKNDKGAQVMASNPTQAPRLDFSVPADGDYTLAVEHLHNWGGPDEVYRLTLTPYQPDFSLTLAIDRWDVAPGGSVSIPIFATRTGYNGPIEVSVAGAKGLTGTVTLPAGPKPPNVPSGVLAVKAEDLPPGPLSFVIQGKATIDGKAVQHLASVRALVATAMGNLAIPPLPMTTQLGMAITEKPPFSLSAKMDAPMVQPGKPITATITVNRVPGFLSDIAVTVQGLPAGTTMAPAKIPAMQNMVQVKLDLKPNVKIGQTLLTFQGAAKHAGRDWAVRASPVPLVVKK
jgi:hypothetical protein